MLASRPRLAAQPPQLARPAVSLISSPSCLCRSALSAIDGISQAWHELLIAQYWAQGGPGPCVGQLQAAMDALTRARVLAQTGQGNAAATQALNAKGTDESCHYDILANGYTYYQVERVKSSLVAANALLGTAAAILQQPDANSGAAVQSGGSSPGAVTTATTAEPASSPPPTVVISTPTTGATFNVQSYGAKGDGQSNDASAVLAAMQAACSASGGGTVLFPGSGDFLISGIDFSGPCAGPLTILVDGTILAPQQPSNWPQPLPQALIQINYVDNLSIVGPGTIDGQGQVWWQEYGLGSRPHLVMVNQAKNLQIKGVTIQNSPWFHLFMSYCQGVVIDGIEILAPADSPNTDGIHVGYVSDVLINNAHIDNGDDCVSIATGTSDISITNMYCAHGHGVSIGSLGRDQSSACVNGVTVSDCTFSATQNGARIKTWSGGKGTVQNVVFKDLTMINAANPIIIDQNYCDSNQGGCGSSSSSSLQLSNIQVSNIHGTVVPFNNFAGITVECASGTPCSGVSITNIDLTVAGSGTPSSILCTAAYGSQDGSVGPCVQGGGYVPANQACPIP
eukprot:SM000035S13057  [mRNA]  locus=s35:129946:133091:- [translate_table: standard]